MLVADEFNKRQLVLREGAVVAGLAQPATTRAYWCCVVAGTAVRQHTG